MEGSRSSGWGNSIDLPSPGGRPRPLRRHTIVDGDTLEALALTYLGTPERWREIYELNREVLPSPALLPIGVTLRIPPRSSAGGEVARPRQAPALHRADSP